MIAASIAQPLRGPFSTLPRPPSPSVSSRPPNADSSMTEDPMSSESSRDSTPATEIKQSPEAGPDRSQSEHEPPKQSQRQSSTTDGSGTAAAARVGDKMADSLSSVTDSTSPTAASHAPGPGTAPKDGLAALLGPGITTWPHGSAALTEALRLRSEQERTKQEFYRLENRRRTLDILELAMKAGVPGHGIPAIFGAPSGFVEYAMPQPVQQTLQPQPQPQQQHTHGGPIQSSPHGSLQAPMSTSIPAGQTSRGGPVQITTPTGATTATTPSGHSGTASGPPTVEVINFEDLRRSPSRFRPGHRASASAVPTFGSSSSSPVAPARRPISQAYYPQQLTMQRPLQNPTSPGGMPAMPPHPGVMQVSVPISGQMPPVSGTPMNQQLQGSQVSPQGQMQVPQAQQQPHQPHQPQSDLQIHQWRPNQPPRERFWRQPTTQGNAAPSGTAAAGSHTAQGSHGTPGNTATQANHSTQANQALSSNSAPINSALNSGAGTPQRERSGSSPKRDADERWNVGPPPKLAAPINNDSPQSPAAVVAAQNSRRRLGHARHRSEASATATMRSPHIKHEDGAAILANLASQGQPSLPPGQTHAEAQAHAQAAQRQASPTHFQADGPR